MRFHGVTRVVPVHAIGRHEQRTVDANLVHRRHHLVAGDFGGSVQ